MTPAQKATAQLFADIWNAGYDTKVHPYDRMVKLGLLAPLKVWPDGGYGITDLGREVFDALHGRETPP